MPQTIKIKCVDNKGFENYLLLNKIYEAYNSISMFYLVFSNSHDLGYRYHKNRFVIVE